MDNSDLFLFLLVMLLISQIVLLGVFIIPDKPIEVQETMKFYTADNPTDTYFTNNTKTIVFKHRTSIFDSLRWEGSRICYMDGDGVEVWCNNVSEQFAKALREGREK